MFDPFYCPDRPLEPPVSRTVYKCPHCNEDIEEGHDIVEYKNVMYHYNCFDDIVLRLLAERGAKGVTVTEGVCPLCGEPFTDEDCEAIEYEGKVYHCDCFEDHADAFIVATGARIHEIAVYNAPDFDNPFYGAVAGGDF